jgi:bifunctional non-homologous end joining protein LigD
LYDEKASPVYVGKVGTGFSQKDTESLTKTFQDVKTEETTIKGVDVAEKVTWLKPGLVCEVAYQTVTKDGKLRMPRFRVLRTDKNALECTLDQIRPSSLEEHVS